jgi:hypothetical protein
MVDDRAAAWLTAVEQELGLDDVGTTRPTVDDMAETVGEHVDAALVAQTALLVGIAAGRAADASVAADDFAGKVDALARGWNADSERAEPANDQNRRA